MAKKIKRTIVLFGCSKHKRPYVADMKRGNRVLPHEFYQGDLFSKRMRYMDLRLQLSTKLDYYRWGVLSAFVGLWWSDVEKNVYIIDKKSMEPPKPYDMMITELTQYEKASWVVEAVRDVIHACWHYNDIDDVREPIKTSEVSVELHAGIHYRLQLTKVLKALGFVVINPLRGMEIGEQKAWYLLQIERLEERLKHDERATG